MIFNSIKKIFELDLLEDKTSLADSIKAKFTGTWDEDFLSVDNAEIRNAMGIASNKKGWFKRIDLGAQVAEICMKSLGEFKGKHLHTMLTDLNNWAAK